MTSARSELIGTEICADLLNILVLPNIPDLNLVNYKVWDIMQHKVYQIKVKDLVDLKCRLIDVWAGIQQSLIDDAINVSAPVFEPEVDTSNIRSDSRIIQTLRTLINSTNISF